MGDSEKEKEACSIEGCSTPKRTRGWCPKHWTRWKTHGDPLYIKTSQYIMGGTNEERFWPKVDITDHCWSWTAATTPGKAGRRQGVFGFKRDDGTWTTVSAAKFSYESCVGPVPEGFELDWTCKNYICVNRDHLECVTREELLRRARDLRCHGKLEPFFVDGLAT